MKRLAAMVTLATAGIALTQLPASATTTQLDTYQARLSGIMNSSYGTATVDKVRFTQPGLPTSTGWGAEIHMKKLPQGNYTFELPIAVDDNHDGKADQGHWSFVAVCNFYSNGATDLNAGCGAAFTLPANAMLNQTYAEVWAPTTPTTIGTKAAIGKLRGL